MQQPRAVIIGSGVAGLASAIRLSVKGFDVTVYEMNDYPGGKLSYFEKEGFHFDAGPSLFTQPQNIADLFELAGEDIKDYFSYYSLPVACRYFYEDGTIINGYTNASAFAQELAQKAGEDEAKVYRYLKESQALFNDVGTIFLNYSLHKPVTLLKAGIAKALSTVKLKHLFNTMNEVNSASFKQKKTVQLFNRYATYNGSNPYKAPGMLCLIPHLEHNEGTFYPKGGMISITNALYTLALKKGAKFFFDSKVQRINCEAGKVVSVSVNGKDAATDIVVSNMDVYGTYKFLLQDDHKAKHILKQERGSSAIVFYWGIKKEFPGLHLHNIFFSDNYEEEFHCIFTKKTLYPDPTVYINITSKCEPGVQAPAGKENWFVMVNAPSGAENYTPETISNCRKHIITKLNRLLGTDIDSLIEVEEVLDPAGIENKTASFMGALYGTSSNSKMAAFMRQANFSKQVKGLYFAGGSVHPGGGIPLCLKSAKIMSEIVADDMKDVLR